VRWKVDPPGFRFDPRKSVARFSVIVPGTNAMRRRKETVYVERRDEALALWREFRDGVLRSEAVDKKEFDPRAYSVFGPKIVATRGFFEDRALESRFLTEEMGHSKLREDIPISLPDCQKEEALNLRNKLLLFRFRNLQRPKTTEPPVDRGLEPRLAQIFSPLLSVMRDEGARVALLDLARRYQRELVSERGMDTEAQILEIIRELKSSSPDGRLSIGDIASLFSARYGGEYEKPVTAKWIGHLLRKKLHLKPEKSHGIYVLSISEDSVLGHLYEKYGLTGEETETDPIPKLHDRAPPFIDSSPSSITGRSAKKRTSLAPARRSAVLQSPSMAWVRPRLIGRDWPRFGDGPRKAKRTRIPLQLPGRRRASPPRRERKVSLEGRLPDSKFPSLVTSRPSVKATITRSWPCGTSVRAVFVSASAMGDRLGCLALQTDFSGRRREGFVSHGGLVVFQIERRPSKCTAN
jgi:hypothetical protein